MGHGRYFPPPSGTYMPLGPLGPIDPYITFLRAPTLAGRGAPPLSSPFSLTGSHLSTVILTGTAIFEKEMKLSEVMSFLTPSALDAIKQASGRACSDTQEARYRLRAEQKLGFLARRGQSLGHQPVA